MTLLTIRNHFRQWREWELNPVVVKELRQAVRSWAVTGTLMLFLAVLFCTSVAFLIMQGFGLGSQYRVGGELFQAFAAILSFASLLFIPLYVGVRLSVERQESNLDLLYITTLTPEQIIRGKFLCGAYMAVLFYSACMPFMAFTNLLRGVDLPTVAFILLCLFLVICAALQVGIFIACLPVSRVMKILAALCAVVLLFPMTFALIQVSFGVMRSGVGTMMGGLRFWTGFFVSVGGIAGAVVLLHFLSVAMISPPSANRALPVRSYLTGVWLLGLAGCCYDARFMLPWAIATFLVLTLALVVVISNRDELSPRVRRQVPARLGRRALAFLFFNGAAGGLTWIVLLMALTFAVVCFLMPSVPGMSTDERTEFLISAASCVFYVLSYALTGLLLHRYFFKRRPPKLAGVLSVLVPALWTLAPSIALFFMNRLSFRTFERTQIGSIANVFMVRDATTRLGDLACAMIWFLVVAILAARWYARQWKQFQPLESATVPLATARDSVPPVITGPTR
jgi:hypothetical protein